MLWLYLKAILGLGVVTVAAFGAGAWMTRILPSSLRRGERVAFVLLGGFGVLSTTLFLVGQMAFTRVTIGVILACGVGLAIWRFRYVISTDGASEISFKGRWHDPSPSRWASPSELKGQRYLTDVSSGVVPRLPAIIICGVLMLTGISGLAEITGDWGNDAVAYHLLGPKEWLRDGVIRPVLDNCHTAFPAIPETLFATLWSVGGNRAPDFSSFVTLALLLVMAGSLAMRCGLSDGWGWWAAAIVATMPAVYAGARECFVDAIFAGFVLAAIRIGVDAHSFREWAPVGMFCGFAVGTKYTGLLVAPAVLIGLVVLNLQREGWKAKSIGGKLVTAGGVACLMGAPYYVRNWMLLGCPIYPPPPGYAAFCSPKYMPAEAIAQFHEYIRKRGSGLGRGIFAFLLLPFNLTYHTANFHGAGGIGLCPLALGPIGMWWSRKNDVARVLIALMCLLTLVWFVTQQESRFLIDVYVLAAVFAVIGWQAVQSAGRNFSKCLAWAVLLISFGYGLFMIVKADKDDVRAVFSVRYAAERREKTIPYFASFAYVNGENAVRKVLVLDRSVPPYYFEKGYVKPVGQWGERTLPGEPDAVAALRLALAHRLDVTHVMDVKSEVADFQVKPGTPGLKLVFQAENQRVYRVE